MNGSKFAAFIAVVAGLILSQAASAQTVSIVAGNGQAVCPGCPGFTAAFFTSLVVKVTDANGNPLANQTVSWTSSGGQLLAQQTSTDANGISFNNLTITNFVRTNVFQSFTQYTVNAQSANSTATFYLTQGFTDPFNAFASAFVVSATNVPVGSTLTGQVGAPSNTTYQVKVADEFSNAIPNVAVSLVNNQDASTGATVQCATNPPGAGANISLTDASGTGTCTPVFLSPGKGQFTVLVGTSYPGGDLTQTPVGIYNSLPLNLNVTPGAAGTIKPISSTSQSGTIGTAVTLTAETDSSAGSPLSGVSVTWKVSPSTSANLSSATSTSDANGRVSTSVTPTAAGTITVTASLTSDSTKSATFTITAGQQVQISGFTIISGNNQSAAVGSAFGQPLTVQVVTTFGSAANIPVNFAVSSGSVTLSANSATTNNNGQAQVTATAGSVTGPATVTATVAGNTGVGTQTFNLTVLPQAPSVVSGYFVNGADWSANSLSPCSIGAIQTNTGLLGATGAVPTLPGFPISTNTVKITIGGAAAPILSIGSNVNNRDEIRFQVPCSVSPGSSVPAVININGATSNVNLNVQAASPGIFQTMNSDNNLRVVMVRPDGSFVSIENPARRGESEVVYVTGLGPTNPAAATPTAFNGAALPPPSTTAGQTNALNVQGTVIVGMAGQGLPLNYARLSDDLVGVYVVSFQIPSDMSTGNNVSFSVGVIPPGASTAIYSATTKVPVQ